MISTRLTTLALATALTFGCQKGTVDIGDPMVGATLADYVGAWSGYAEAYSFNPSGSDRIHLTIDPTGQGTMELGDGPQIPLPTDPDIGYPPDYATRWSANGGFANGLTEGFRYPTHEVSVDSGRLRFGLFPNELFAPWCAMQTPIASKFGGYSCVHDDWGIRYGSVADASTPPDCGALACCVVYEDGLGAEMVVDCGKHTLCDYPNTGQTVCVCTAASCSAATPEPGQLAANQYPVYLDLTLETGGRKLTGSLVLPTDRVTVRLSR